MDSFLLIYTTIKKAVYIILGYDMYGKKDILGLYIGQVESARFWLSVLEDIQCRGVKDILIACMDNLSGFTQAIESIFPKTDVQLCIIHQLRNSLKYVSHKNKKLVINGLKKVYQAPNIDAAQIAMDEFEAQWNTKYPLIIKSWRAWIFLIMLTPFPEAGSCDVFRMTFRRMLTPLSNN